MIGWIGLVLLFVGMIAGNWWIGGAGTVMLAYSIYRRFAGPASKVRKLEAQVRALGA